jgi:hypothetical protein
VAEESENKPDDAFEENEALRDELAEVLAEIWSERVDLLDRIRSYPESLERDKALVEQLGKQWDMVKAEADDLSRRDEKYGLEKAVEGVRIAYDWFKHLTTVSTGSVLLITALTKALFPDPHVAWLLVVSLIGFLLSALASVLAMAGRAETATATPAVPVRGLWKAFLSGPVQQGLLYFVLVCFVTGIVAFTVFAAYNAI